MTQVIYNRFLSKEMHDHITTSFLLESWLGKDFLKPDPHCPKQRPIHPRDVVQVTIPTVFT